MSKIIIKSDYLFPAINYTIKKGTYDSSEVKHILGNSYQFVLNCTDFKNHIEIIETPEDNLNIETKIPKIKKKSGK